MYPSIQRGLLLVIFLLQGMVSLAQTATFEPKRIKLPPIRDSITVLQIYTAVEQPPTFKGSNPQLNHYLRTNFRRPSQALDTAAPGRVVVQFIVWRDGSISDVQLVKGLEAVYDQEVIRLIQAMPKWEAAMQNGKVCDFKCVLFLNCASTREAPSAPPGNGGW